MSPAGLELWSVVAIVAIVAANVRRWMVFYAKQRALGASTGELEKAVAQLTKAKNELAQRLENLETIVVSQTWGALHDKGLSAAERELAVATAAHQELRPDGDATAANQQRAEQLARRLQ